MSTWSRRKVLAAGAGAAASTLAAISAQGEERIPRRMLGKTGMRVSILGLGGGSQFLSACKTDEEAIELLNTAIDGGINYLDCAAGYGNGESERRYGLVLEKRRKEVYVTTKTQLRDRDPALKEFERSLKNFRTDRVDLVQIHAINPDEDLDRITGKDGVFPALLELKSQKVIRAVGITGHLAATRMAELVRRIGDAGLDTVLCPVNPAADSRHYIDKKDPAEPNGHFRTELLPIVREKGLGLIAMKVTGQKTLIGEGPGLADVPTLIRFAMSEPGVAVAIVGPGSLPNLKANLATAQGYAPLTDSERRRLARNFYGVAHRLAYHDPAYRDA